jgi:hypothetical protein
MNIKQKFNRCTASSNDLDGPGGRRTRAFTKTLIEELDAKMLWDEYGIDGDILVCLHFGMPL